MTELEFTDMDETLAPDDRPVVAVLAVAATTIPRSYLIRCFKTLGVRRSSGKAFTTRSLDVQLTALHAAGVVTYATHPFVAPELAWRVFEATPRDTLERVAAALRTHYPVDRPERARREIQLALFLRDADALEHLVASPEGLMSGIAEAALAHVRASGDPRLIALLAADQLRLARRRMRPDEDALRDLEAAAATGQTAVGADRELARTLILRGRFDDARAVVDRHPDDPHGHALRGWVAAATGDAEGARASFDSSLRSRAQRASSPPAQLGPELIVRAIVGLGDPKLRGRLTEMNDFRLRDAGADDLGCVSSLSVLASFLKTGEAPDEFDDDVRYRYARLVSEADAWEPLCAALTHALTGTSLLRRRVEVLRGAHGLAVKAEQPWLAGQIAAVVARVDPPGGLATPYPSLLDSFVVTPVWETKLRRLERAVAEVRPTTSEPEGAEAPDTRLVWMLDYEYGDRIDVHPREQRRNAKGRWSKGRRVALGRLYGARPSYEPPLTAADHAVCSYIEESVAYSHGYRDISYYLDTEAAFGALAEHPHVYWLDDPSQPVTLREVEPSLHVTRDGDELVLRLDPPATQVGAHLERRGPFEVAIVRVSPTHQKLGGVLKKSGLRVPAGADARVEKIIAAVAGTMQVHSDIGAATSLDVSADARPTVQLVPVGDGLQVRVRVRPLGPGGPALSPGQGAATVSARLDGEVRGTARDLAAERANGEALLSACPAILAGYENAAGEWEIADRDTCLELVLQLAEAGDDVLVEWPAGAALRVVGRADVSALRLRVSGGKSGWFDVAGDLVVDPELTVELGELLTLVADSPGRFVSVAPGQFVALSDRFRHHLDGLARLAERRARGRLTLHPWASGALEPLAEGAGDTAAFAGWREMLQARREAARSEPEAPATLRATLRGYQREGFVWLARLAQLGAGACLADDMGLGKTVQTLALLVRRAPAGPQLVVCPTSVVGGWLDEAERFAPTLRVQLLGSGDRAAAVAGASPFDVVLASYGLLQSEAELLASRRWETVVLDEAQAIKNPDTQRAKAARSLDAGFRLALTGTPVENRLDELWSLFAFLVPGLLGSRAAFQRRFARPIDEGDRAARAALRQLIRPLLLRRLKSEVLDELPEKTETRLRVELSPGEAALYEALRQRAVASLADHADQGNGQRRIRVLAEIMRLRRACCHPRLVSPELAPAAPPEGLGSAKLEALAELVSELSEGGHRALVYSQFVDHLAVVREWLDAEGIPYQYLDGGTPQRARRARVAAFQAGEGALFLISLRAGGTGLNLTGADFVIHLDPWWNPAVEDQASDRIHRIGQERPVTVVRLVARGTIEERIIALHKRKRALADGILAGADAAAKLDLDALLALLAPGD